MVDKYWAPSWKHKDIARLIGHLVAKMGQHLHRQSERLASQFPGLQRLLQDETVSRVIVNRKNPFAMEVRRRDANILGLLRRQIELNGKAKRLPLPVKLVAVSR